MALIKAGSEGDAPHEQAAHREIEQPLAERVGLGKLSIADLKAGSKPGEGNIASPSPYPATVEEQRQEFVDGFGNLGLLYQNAVNDPGGERFERFQNRMQSVYQFDHKTFMDMAQIGHDLLAKKLTPAQTGKEIGRIIQKTLSRHSNDAPGSPQMTVIEGAGAGIFLAARANFESDPAKQTGQTRSMIDAAESVLSASKASRMLHAVNFADTNEPGFDVYQPGLKRDRHNYTGQ